MSNNPIPFPFFPPSVFQCRAVAAAVFGDPQNVDKYVKFTVLDSFDRFTALNSYDVDLLARTTTHTMERQVKEVSCFVTFFYCCLPFLFF